MKSTKYLIVLLIIGLQVSTINSQIVVQWLGNTNEWQLASNWDNNTIPLATTDINIPSVPAGGKFPVISTNGNNYCRNLSIESSAGITVTTANTLNISGNITNNGNAYFGDGTIIIAGASAQQLTGVCSFNMLYLNNGNTFTLNGKTQIKGILTIYTGNLITNDQLELNSDASTTALISGTGTGTITGKVNVERYISGINGYHYLSSPATDAIANNFAKYGNGAPIWGQSYETYQSGPISNIWFYDETSISQVQHPLGTMQNGWVSPSDSTEVLALTKGYSLNIASAKVINIKGTVNSGLTSMTLTKTASPKPTDDGWNLVGNPYPSPIDWKSAVGWIKSNIYDGIYFFNPSTQYTGTISSFINGVSSDGLADRFIPVMQGFWVRAKANTTLKMTNQVRVDQTNVDFIKSNKNNFKLLRLVASGDADGLLKDYSVVYFTSNATEKFDDECDAFKMANNDELVPNLSSVNSENINFSINGLPDSFTDEITIPLSYRVNTKGYYRLLAKDIQNIKSNIFLDDVQLDTTIDLQKNPAYIFYISPDSSEGRFFLRIKNFNNTGMQDKKTLENINITSHDKSIIISVNHLRNNAKAEIYNLEGQLLSTQPIVNGINTIKHNLVSGCYIVKVISNSKVINKKVFIN